MSMAMYVVSIENLTSKCLYSCFNLHSSGILCNPGRTRNISICSLYTQALKEGSCEAYSNSHTILFHSIPYGCGKLSFHYSIYFWKILLFKVCFLLYTKLMCLSIM